MRGHRIVHREGTLCRSEKVGAPGARRYWSLHLPNLRISSCGYSDVMLRPFSPDAINAGAVAKM